MSKFSSTLKWWWSDKSGRLCRMLDGSFKSRRVDFLLEYIQVDLSEAKVLAGELVPL
jgi:hypothetical protein